jgi:hypothetical protein
MRYVVPILLLLSTQAQAGFYTGNDLFQYCRSYDPLVLGYLAGLEDAAERTQLAEEYVLAQSSANYHGNEVVSTHKATHPYCLQSTVTLGQLSEVFCRYLEQFPSERHLTASALVSKALTQAFPCN